MPEVLNQGDPYVSNVIYKARHDAVASDELLAFIDWQLAHYGFW